MPNNAITCATNEMENGNSKVVKKFQPKGGYEVTTFLQSETNNLEHQIAGHTRTGVLKHKKFGYVLKPIQKEPFGSREIEFYMKVYNHKSTENGNIISKQHQRHNKILQTYLPNYYGVVKIQSTDEDGKPIWNYYIAMEDLLEGFKKPCVIDVKIGSQTWDKYATLEKIAHEKSKYLGTKEPLGISLTGMQYYDLIEKKSKKMEKDFGKTLSTTTLNETIELFFNGTYDKKLPKLIAKKLLPRLEEILEYFETQREFGFYSSSLLIGYDAEVFEAEDNEKLEKVDSWLRIYMIDFAHVIPMEDDSKQDTNYLFGLCNFINILKNIEQDSQTL